MAREADATASFLEGRGCAGLRVLGVVAHTWALPPSMAGGRHRARARWILWHFIRTQGYPPYYSQDRSIYFLPVKYRH